MRGAVCLALAAAACGGPGPSSSAVADCKAAVANVRAACVAESASSPRLCIYDALQPLCASGRTDVMTAIFDCLKMDACQSPSDPSGAATCVQNVIAQDATSADKALGAAVCGCEGSSAEPGCANDLPAYTLATAMLMTESDVMALTSCISTMGCQAMTSCANNTPLAPAQACP